LPVSPLPKLLAAAAPVSLSTLLPLFRPPASRIPAAEAYEAIPGGMGCCGLPTTGMGAAAWLCLE
jgi:hypothetical protein